MQTLPQDPPKLHFPFMLMMLALVLSVVLPLVVAYDPSGNTGSNGSIAATP